MRGGGERVEGVGRLSAQRMGGAVQRRGRSGHVGVTNGETGWRDRKICWHLISNLLEHKTWRLKLHLLDALHGDQVHLMHMGGALHTDHVHLLQSGGGLHTIVWLH